MDILFPLLRNCIRQWHLPKTANSTGVAFPMANGQSLSQERHCARWISWSISISLLPSAKAIKLLPPSDTWCVLRQCCGHPASSVPAKSHRFRRSTQISSSMPCSGFKVIAFLHWVVPPQWSLWRLQIAPQPVWDPWEYIGAIWKGPHGTPRRCLPTNTRTGSGGGSAGATAASASAGWGRQPAPAETAFASKPAKAEPSCSSKNPSESEPSDLSDPASNSCHSCSSPSPEETSLPGNLEAFLGTRFRGPLGFRFLLCRGPRASAAALTAICCSLICLANRIKSSFWEVSVLDTSNLCKCLTLSTLQTDTDHSSETRASCTHKLTSVFHSGPNVLLCKSNVNGGRFFLGLSSSSSSRIMSSMLFNIRRNRFWNDLPITFNQIFTDHHMNFKRTSNDPRMHDKRTIRPKKKRPPFKWQSNKSQN